MRKINFYKTELGKSPIEDFFDSLPAKLFQKVSWTIELVKQLPIVPSEYLKKLTGTDEIWEIRTQLGSTAIRLLGFFDGSDVIIVTNGFSKKTDRVPKREIALAEERRKEYFRRKKK